MNKKPLSKPPRWALHFLQWFCKAELWEEISGDLQEEFEIRKASQSLVFARLMYVLQVFTFLRPFAVKQIRVSLYHWNPTAMYLHYLKVALRNFAQQKLFATINVLSLAIGLTCTTLIYLYIQHETNFDNFHQYGDRIYRINSITKDSSNAIFRRNASQYLFEGPLIASEIPEIESYTRISSGKLVVKNESLEAKQEVYLADSTMLEMFSFPLLYGNPNTALTGINQVVITREIAKKYFGKLQVLGKRISVFYKGAYRDCEISGVMESIPANSSFQFDLLVPLAFKMAHTEVKEGSNETLMLGSAEVYALLHPKTFLPQLNLKLPDLYRNHFSDPRYPRAQETLAWMDQEGYTASYQFQPLTTIHTSDELYSRLAPPVNTFYFYILGGIAGIILVIACINFMILAIGRSARRGREIGIRKSIGARYSQLFAQFVGESVLLSLMGLLLGLGLVSFLIPTFNQLAETNIQSPSLFSPRNLVILLGISILSGLLAGAHSTIQF